MLHQTPACFAALLVGSWLGGCGRSALFESEGEAASWSSSAGSGGGTVGSGGADNGSSGPSSSVGSSSSSVGSSSSSGGGMCAGPEVCDGLDNDCNGSIDEGNPGGGEPCTTGLPGVCGAGTTACFNGALVCQQLATPGVETCNGVDDDCNGLIDDGLALCDCESADFGGHVYLFCSTTLSFSQASAACMSFGSHLASIGSAREDAFIFETANEISHSRWWIGFTDALREGTFAWSDGSPVTYTNWNFGEPNNVSEEDCTQLNRFFPDDTWNDATCETPLFFVCEQP